MWAKWSAIILFIPRPLKMVRYPAVSLIPPKARESALRKRTMPRQVRMGLRPQVMSRKHLRVKISRSTLTPRTPSLVLVSSLVSIRTLTQSPTAWQKQCKDSPKEDSPKKDSSRSLSSEEEPPTNEVLQDRAR